MKKIKFKILFLAFFTLFSIINFAYAAEISLNDLRVEYKNNPLGIDSVKPRFSWKLVSDARSVMQTAYRIQVSAVESNWSPGAHIVWDSQKIMSDDSIHVDYKGAALESFKRYHWRVTVWDNKNNTATSEQAYWEMGILNPSEWKAKWIQAHAPSPKQNNTTTGKKEFDVVPSPLLRREFSVAKSIAHARAYVTSHGLYELYINGRRVGDQYFTPGWTSLNKRLQYQTYDVTALIKTGANAVGAVLGDGWYRGRLGWQNASKVYGDDLSLLMQLHIEYSDGTQESVATDTQWKQATGPILASSLYDGEIYDARLEKLGWKLANYDDSTWKKVELANHDKTTLVAAYAPPVKKIQVLEPVSIARTKEGHYLVDIGQNMVGWVRLVVKGKAGQKIRLRHAEVLDKAGQFYTDNLRSAKQINEYILRGNENEIYEPTFTFQGFRYVLVEGYPNELTKADIEAIVLHSDMETTGEFTTSHPLINQLQHNIQWGQKGNFLDVPTDCPQRDERMGWTGDAQVFARTAAFNMNVSSFFIKWLKDLALDQFDDGAVPHVIPDVLSKPGKQSAGAAAWGDAAVIVPWNMYLVYGDKKILADQYQSMKRWVDYQKNQAGNSLIWRKGEHFGDWLSFASTDPSYPGATTNKDYIATAFFAHSSDLLQRTALVLGKKEDAQIYRQLFESVKAAWLQEFVTPSGRISENTQTAYALALEFDLLPEKLRPIAAKRLAEEIRTRKHLTTGFVGTPYLTHVLSRYGYLDEAYKLLSREDYPSWLYPIKQGATTIWERWDGQKPNGDFQTPEMNSFNHYAYGAIGDWMYRVVAGLEIDAEQPAYKHSLIQPTPGGGLTQAHLVHESLYGRIVSSWRIDNNQLTLSVEIPANTTSTIRLANTRQDNVAESRKKLTNVDGIMQVSQQALDVVVQLGSGKYEFSYPILE